VERKDAENEEWATSANSNGVSKLYFLVVVSFCWSMCASIPCFFQATNSPTELSPLWCLDAFFYTICTRKGSEKVNAR
jgi:hypothetical protein